MSRVLLVDDDENLLRIAQKLLAREEPTLKTVTALSAQEALQKLAEESFEMVVADYRMPGMDGLIFLKTLRDEGNDIPFIMFTGQGREEVAMQALNLGADYYLMKGGDVKCLYGELAHIIRQVMQHKRTEKALRESEARYRELVEKLHEGVLVEDAEEVITFVNPRTAEMLGYAEEDLVGRHWATIVPNTELDKVRSETAKRLRGISGTYEGTLLAQDGRPVPVIISATPLFSASGAFRGVLTVFTDITSRKQAEDTLRESEQRYKIIKQTTTEGFWRLDLQGRILDVNDTLCQMLGWTRDELLELSVADIEAAENPEEVAQHITKIMEQGYDRFETRHRCKDGTLLDIEVNVSYWAGEGGEIIAFLRDITEHKRAEEQLKQQMEEGKEAEERIQHQHAFLENVLESLTHPFYVIDANDYTIKLANTAAGFGPLSDSLTCFALTHRQNKPCGGQDHPCPIEEVKRTKQPVVVEHMHYNQDDVGRLYEVHGYPILDTEGNLQQLIEYNLEITDRKQAEAALKIKDVAIASSINAIAFANLEGNLTYVNDAFLELWGYEHAQKVMGRPAAEFWQEPGKASEVIEVLQAKGHWIGELIARRK
ncbi:MAG: PAS domain S-box protein, partial [Candidatus Hodarchaeales archaeon]